jgi:NAD(P)-dependent dehydrogenase (short-subunit alcohol dehydrogenase family)
VLGAGSAVVVAARTPVPSTVGTFVAADLSTEEGARRLAAAALDILGGIDVLIDNAGSQRRVPDGALAMTDDDWTGDISANLLSAVRLDRELLPTMVAQRSGVVVHISSGAARLPQPAALRHPVRDRRRILPRSVRRPRRRGPTSAHRLLIYWWYDRSLAGPWSR